MDERQKPTDQQQMGQIREGAGLEESRLNQDFVDFLRRWSTPILLVIVLIAGAYIGMQRWRAAQAAALDAAFAELDLAMRAGSPDALVAVAKDHEGQRSVAMLARMSAADIYLASARRGVVVGATLRPDGTPEQESDLLTAEQREMYLTQAADLYRRIADQAGSRRETAVTSLSAMFGVAAVAEMRGDLEEAGRVYTRIAEKARTSALPDIEGRANAAKASLGELSNPPVLFAMSQLPAEPQAPGMGAPQDGMPVFYDSEGNPIRLQRMEGPPPGVNTPEGAGIPAGPLPDPGAEPVGPELPPAEPTP